MSKINEDKYYLLTISEEYFENGSKNNRIYNIIIENTDPIDYFILLISSNINRHCKLINYFQINKDQFDLLYIKGIYRGD